MKLKTSFFNTTVLKKDITRFAPLWGLYTVFTLLFLFLFFGDGRDPANIAADAPYIMMAMGIVNFIYAGLCAMVLFGDLFSSKMCNALHAMPMRREGWFLTHLSAGLIFCIGPNAVGAIIASMMLQQYCYLVFIWLAIMICQFLFFFGAGAFSAQCAGNRLGAVAIYFLLNFLAVLAAFFIYTFYAPVLYGVKINWKTICRCSPVVGFSMMEYVSVSYNSIHDRADFAGFIGSDWQYLFIALAVGLLLLAAAVMLYRRRQMESAGDFMAVKPASPIFLTLYTLCVGAVLYFIADALNTQLAYLFLVIGFAIGFFTGWMLLEKKVNIFKPKRFLGFGIFTLAFFLTITLTILDPIGITRYVPDEKQVESVTVSPYAADYYLENEGVTLSDPEAIAKILWVHSELVTNRTDGALCIQLRYRLKDGRTVDRKYYLDADSACGIVLEQYLSDFRYVMRHEDPQQLADRIYSVEFYSYYEGLKNIAICTPAEQAEQSNKYKYENEDWKVIDSRNIDYFRGLLTAIEADCETGLMAQNWEFHRGEESLGHLEIRYFSGSATKILDLTIFQYCENTYSYLKGLSDR